MMLRKNPSTHTEELLTLVVSALGKWKEVMPWDLVVKKLVLPDIYTFTHTYVGICY